jgi:hypothetical protein
MSNARHNPGTKGRRNRRVVAVVSAGAGIALLGGITVAQASIPAAGGVIKACYNSQNGLTRIIDSSAACAKTEKAISWNQTGPRGASVAT